MANEEAKFWDPPLVFRSWCGLEQGIADLVAAYGRPAVVLALKGIKGSGNPASEDDLDLRIFIGRLGASAWDGSGPELKDTAIKKLWAARFPEYDYDKKAQQAYRVLKERSVIGLAFVFNERWHKLSVEQQRRALLAAAALPELPEIVRTLARDLADGDPSEFDQAPPLKGLLRDQPGLPRLKRRVKAVADALVGPAFRRGTGPYVIPPVLCNYSPVSSGDTKPLGAGWRCTEVIACRILPIRVVRLITLASHRRRWKSIVFLAEGRRTSS